MQYDSEYNRKVPVDENYFPGPYTNGCAVLRYRNKCGLIDTSGNILVPPVYYFIEDYDRRAYKAILTIPGDKRFLIAYYGTDGTMLLPLQLVIEKGGRFYPSDSLFYRERFPQYDDTKRVNSTVASRYDICQPYFCDRAAVMRNGLWGYVDSSGTEIIPCSYDLALNFSSNRALVRKNNKWGFVDREGKTVIGSDFSYADEFYLGHACILKEKEGYGMVDTSGNPVFPFSNYDTPIYYEEGVYEVDKMIDQKRRYGFYTYSGVELFPCQFAFVSSFKSGCAMVSDNTNWGLATRGGKLFMSYDNAAWASDRNLMVKKDSKWGTIDTNGRSVIPLIYEDAGYYTANMIPLCRNGKWGALDVKGKQVVPFIYSGSFVFFTELAVVKRNGKSGMINKQGKEIVPCTYDLINVDWEKNITAEKAGKKFRISSSGEVSPQ